VEIAKRLFLPLRMEGQALGERLEWERMIYQGSGYRELQGRVGYVLAAVGPRLTVIFDLQVGRTPIVVRVPPEDVGVSKRGAS
jgi:hypothetical protein